MLSIAIHIRATAGTATRIHDDKSTEIQAFSGPGFSALLKRKTRRILDSEAAVYCTDGWFLVRRTDHPTL